MTVLTKIKYRKSEKKDLAKAAELINSCYKRKKTEEYFLWQFYSPQVPSVLMSAFDGDEMIGMFGLQMKEIMPNRLKVGLAIDLVISPKWRKQGHFKALGELAIRSFPQLDLLAVFPNSAGRDACVRSLDFEPVGIIKSFMLDKRVINSSSKFSAESFGQSADLPEAGLTDRYYNFKRDAEYRCWRFALNSLYDYTIVRLSNGDFGIVKVFKDQVSGEIFGDIVDFQTEIDKESRLTELIEACCLHLFSQNAGKIIAWAVPHHVITNVLEKIGFKDADQERCFCLKVLNNDLSDISDFNRWHLVPADAEIY